METFKLIPIDWQAIAALMTFGAVAVSVYSLYSYHRREKNIEKREIIERIIHPLKENLISISNLMQSDPPCLSDFRWHEIKKDNPYLILRLPNTFKYAFDSFYEDLKSFDCLTNQIFPKLKILMFGVVKKILSVNGPAINGTVNINENYIIHNCAYRIEIGGKIFMIYFLELLFSGKNLDERIEEFKSYSDLPNNKLGESKFIISTNAESSKKVFEEVFSNIYSAIENEPELKEYISNGTEIIKKAKKLLSEIG